ncbi:MAG: DUF2797 domain-containing protein [Oligoflexia bacterium]|nr:DUF2797 domain-containing protein [Oligoflexia bacterium]
MSAVSGVLEKMQHDAEAASNTGRPLAYTIFDQDLSAKVGQSIAIAFEGKIFCIHCGRAIKKTFGEGACYPCFQKKAACDICIVKPELCHYAKGTCREPEWARVNCLIPHVVYLCNTTGLKVGITRGFKKFERWGDQGALAAIELAHVPERLVAGLLETALAKHLEDRADWRALITGKHSEVDLIQEAARARDLLPQDFRQFLLPVQSEIYRFTFPVLTYPKKAVTHNLDKQPELQGTLDGIRGQYIFVSGRALNVRKYSGYEVRLEM